MLTRSLNQDPRQCALLAQWQSRWQQQQGALLLWFASGMMVPAGWRPERPAARAGDDSSGHFYRGHAFLLAGVLGSSCCTCSCPTHRCAA